MRIRKIFLTISLLIIICLLGEASPGVQAQSGNGYDLTWNTLEGGGPAAAPDGSFSLYGSFGQPDASQLLSGGAYTLTGGFWSGIPAYSINLPVIIT